jgi:hypothetical protein
MKRSLLLLTMLVWLTPSGVFLHAQSAAAPNAVLVELFTSEGCSSCPPADALLAQMDGKLSPTGQTVIALSEHVTYWNHDGWVDPFSQEIFTDRQSGYKDRFKLDDVYTPQMVINGDQQVSGGNGPAILKALAAEAATPKASVKIVSVAAEGKFLKVTLAVTGELPRQGADIVAGVAENKTSSNVSRGENSGRTLTHVAVVRTLAKVGTVKAATTMTVKVPLGNGPVGAARHLVVFAQTAGQGKVLSVVTMPL